jgi:hypothetical protein
LESDLCTMKIVNTTVTGYFVLQRINFKFEEKQI